MALNFSGMLGGSSGVNIPIAFNYAQAMMALNQLGSGVMRLNGQVQQLRGNMQGVGGGGAGGGAGGMGGGSSIGAFYLLNKAATATFDVFKTGVTEAAKLEQALNRLQSVSGATNFEMAELKKTASHISGDLGPIDILDVVHNMEALNRIVGATVPNIQKYARPFSEFTNAMVLTSGQEVSPEASASMLQQTISAFGGLKDKDNVTAIIEQLYKAISAFSPKDPQKLLKGIQVTASTMRAIGLPMDQLIAMAAFRTALPTGGMRAAGPDIESFIVSGMDVMGRLAKVSPKKRAAREEEFKELGFIRDGRPAILDPKTGAPDLFRLVSSVNSALHDLQRKDPTHFYENMINLFKDVVPEKIGRRLALQFAQDENLKALAEVAAKIKSGDTMAEATKRQEAGTLGAFSKLTSNMQNLLIQIFDDPSRGLGKLANAGAVGAQNLTNQAEDSDAIRLSMTGAFTGLLTGLLSAVGGLLISNLAKFLFSRGGAFGASMTGRALAGGSDIIAATLFGFSKLNLIIAIISGLVLLASLAYKNSPAFAKAVDYVAAPLISFFEGLKKRALAAAQDLFPPPAKEGLEGPQQPWFDRTQGKVHRALSSAWEVIKGGGIANYMTNQSFGSSPNNKGVIGLLTDYVNNSPALRAKNLSKNKYGIDLYPPGEGGYAGSPWEKMKAFIKSPIEESKRIWSETKAFWTGLWDTSINWLKNIYNAIVESYNRMDTIIKDYLNGVAPQVGAAIDTYANPPVTAPEPKTSTPPAANPPDYGFDKRGKGTPKHAKQQEALTGRALMREFTRYLNDDLGLDMRAGSPHRSQSDNAAPIHQR